MKDDTKDLLAVLLDENNRDPITLVGDKGEELSFEQVAVVPLDVENDWKLFVVLKPLDKLEDIADDEAIVFAVDQDKRGNTFLRVEENETTALLVFDKYYELLEEAIKNKK